MTDFLTWTPDAEKALTDLKQVLSSSLCLGLPDTPAFLNLCFSECNEFYNRKFYLSHMVINDLWDTIQKRIFKTKRGMVACLRAVEAATEAVLATVDIVAMCPLTIHQRFSNGGARPPGGA